MSVLDHRLLPVLVLLSALCGAGQAAPPAPARVLGIVEGIGSVPWSGQFLEALRTALLRLHPAVELDIEAFTAINEHASAEEVRARMVHRYAGRQYDIVLVVTAKHLRSLVALRDHHWPEATLVVPIVDAAKQVALKDVPRVTGLLADDAPRTTLDLLFKLLPHTEHLAVISWRRDTTSERSAGLLTGWAHAQGIDLIDLNGLTPEQLYQRVQTFPTHTAVYFDGTAAPVSNVRAPRDLLTELNRLTNAPIFVSVSTGLGTGAVGGAVSSPEVIARDTAAQIDRLLTGSPPATIGFEPSSAPRVQIDWRAMQRWNISEQRLPENVELLYKRPDLWEAYPAQVIAGLVVVTTLSALIAALLIERRRRQQAQMQARQQLNHLARLNRGAALATLSAALAHEINQPLGAIQTNTETAELLLDRGDSSTPSSLRELLLAIRADNARASAVLQRLRAWMANTPGDLRPCPLNPLIIDVSRMLSAELQLRSTGLQLSLASGLPSVWADGVQVQQVVLNLIVNALDALDEVPAGQRRIHVSTSRLDDHQVEITVADNGRGVDISALDQLFEPFVSTKPKGLGVGLAISRSIIERHQGRIWVSSESAIGARFHFTLRAVKPSAPEHA